MATATAIYKRGVLHPTTRLDLPEDTLVAILPLKEYQQLVSERVARFQILDDIRRRMPDLPAEEVEADVAQAIAAVRRGQADAADRP